MTNFVTFSKALGISSLEIFSSLIVNKRVSKSLAASGWANHWADSTLRGTGIPKSGGRLGRDEGQNQSG